MKRSIPLLLLTLSMSMPALAFERQMYFGIGGGASALSPEMADSGFTLSSENGAAASATLGVRLTDRFNAELGFTHLGEAELSGGETIGYTAKSAGLLAYVLGSENGWRGYVRLGLNSMDNKHNIQLKKADNTAVWAGGGFEWSLNSNVLMRAELASFDGDAQAALVSLLYQPGAKRRSAEPKPEEAPAESTKPIVELETKSAPESLPKVFEQAADIKATPVEPAQQAIPTPQRVLQPPQSGVLPGVEFEPGTTALTSIARNVLDRLAESLAAYPALSIEIAAHSDGIKGSQQALKLSRGRAIAVARHLVGKGVAVSRMKARAFGANQPRAEGNSAGAIRLNNRVEISVR